MPVVVGSITVHDDGTDTRVAGVAPDYYDALVAQFSSTLPDPSTPPSWWELTAPEWHDTALAQAVAVRRFWSRWASAAAPVIVAAIIAGGGGGGGSGIPAWDAVTTWNAPALVTHSLAVWLAIATSTNVTPVEGASWTKIGPSAAIDLASPGPIGGSTPGAGTFTAIAAASVAASGDVSGATLHATGTSAGYATIGAGGAVGSVTGIPGADVTGTVPDAATADFADTAGGAPPTGTAGGVLSGTYPAPGFATSPTFTGTFTLTGLASGYVKSASGVFSSVTTIPYSDLTGTPSALPPSGSASGDLSGTYPSPTISGLAVNKLAALTASKPVFTDASGFLTVAVPSSVAINAITITSAALALAGAQTTTASGDAIVPLALVAHSATQSASLLSILGDGTNETFSISPPSFPADPSITTLYLGTQGVGKANTSIGGGQQLCGFGSNATFNGATFVVNDTAQASTVWFQYYGAHYFYANDAGTAVGPWRVYFDAHSYRADVDTYQYLALNGTALFGLGSAGASGASVEVQPLVGTTSDTVRIKVGAQGASKPNGLILAGFYDWGSPSFYPAQEGIPGAPALIVGTNIDFATVSGGTPVATCPDTTSGYSYSHYGAGQIEHYVGAAGGAATPTAVWDANASLSTFAGGTLTVAQGGTNKLAIDSQGVKVAGVTPNTAAAFGVNGELITATSVTRGSIVTIDAYSQRPTVAASQAGDQFVGTDTATPFVRAAADPANVAGVNGGGWRPFIEGQVVGVQPPLAANWTLRQTGTNFALSDANGAVRILATSRVSTEDNGLADLLLPIGAFVLYANFFMEPLVVATGTTSVALCGLYLYETASGKLIRFGTEGSVYQIQINTSLTASSSVPFQSKGGGFLPSGKTIYRIRDDLTNRDYSVSGDNGQTWYVLLTHTRATGFTTRPDRIGFGGITETMTSGIVLTSWNLVMIPTPEELSNDLRIRQYSNNSAAQRMQSYASGAGRRGRF